MGPRIPTRRASASRAARSSCPPAPAAAQRTRRGRSSAWSADRISRRARPHPRPRALRPRRRRRRSGARRRILFADLSGYTAAAERMDPEAVKALVDRTLRLLGEQIERFGGSIDKFIGDNVMGVFGAPVAHEDDPERAVRAGLAMQHAMEEANRQSREKYGVGLLAAGRDQLGRGDGGRRRRPLHGDGRRGQRRRAAAGRRPAGKRHRRGADLSERAGRRSPTSGSSRSAEGQGGAGSRLGGHRAYSPSRAAPRSAPRRR